MSSDIENPPVIVLKSPLRDMLGEVERPVRSAAPNPTKSNPPKKTKKKKGKGGGAKVVPVTDLAALNTTPMVGSLTMVFKIQQVPDSIEVPGGRVFTLQGGPAESPIYFRMQIKNKAWNKFMKATESFAQWGAVLEIRSFVARPTPDLFVVENVGIQVFERKPKVEDTPVSAPTN